MVWKVWSQMAETEPFYLLAFLKFQHVKLSVKNLLLFGSFFEQPLAHLLNEFQSAYFITRKYLGRNVKSRRTNLYDSFGIAYITFSGTPCK